jgi:hypothetical protein
MKQSITINGNNGEQWKVFPRWRGKNLAVHAPVIGGECQRVPGKWVITHLPTGFRARDYFCGTLSEAILAARLWDDIFDTVTPDNAKVWPLREQWIRVTNRGRAERPWRPRHQVEEILAKAA